MRTKAPTFICVRPNLVIIFSLTEAPPPTPPRPHPTPRNGPETDPKQTRNRPKRIQTNPKRTETDPKWTEIKLSGVGRPGVRGFVGIGIGGGVGGCKGKRKSLAQLFGGQWPEALCSLMNEDVDQFWPELRPIDPAGLHLFWVGRMCRKEGHRSL